MAKEDTDLKRTPLYPYYKNNNVKLIEFGSWALPVQFTKLSEEHQVVRERVGLFDVSHMGEIMVEGKQATAWLNRLITNDVAKVEPNQAVYTLVTNETGGILDDIIIFKLSDTAYMLTPNASNTDKIQKWLTAHQQEGITLTDVSEETGLIAIQGPKAADVVAEVFGEEARKIKNYHFSSNVSTDAFDDVLLSRTGYTGEDGYECYVKWDQTEALWKKFLEIGEAYGIQECGLGARDTLRLEAGMPLYGQDLSEDVTPLEAGLRFAVKWDKPEPFIGQKALEKQQEEGTTYLSRGFEVKDRGIARTDYIVFNEADEEIGVVTSGTQSPTLSKSIGFMRIKKAGIKLGDTVRIQVRKNQLDAEVTKKNFLKN